MPNCLADCASLYLRKHANNPIDWWPWCEEALAKAKAEDKPIFLSIGYSSCHWCTVMEGEAFSDPAVAAYLNAHYVPIKVDREERPDLDSLYMQSLQMMTGQGGWPLNIFLSPDDLLPFYAGTYFPLDPRYGRPGFLHVLQALIGHYQDNPEQLKSVRQQVLAGLQQQAALGTETALASALLKRGLEIAVRILMPNPAFQQNSFPMMPYAETALRATRSQDTTLQTEAQEVCRQRALDLVLGGICDHVAGGFHRYTVDPTWTVPHFEKMLYDNGQILEYLAHVWGTGLTDAALLRAMEGIVNWLQREMTAPEGYFYAAQDADSFVDPQAIEPEEGAFYAWPFDLLQAVLSPAELEALEQDFTVTHAGNFEGRNVLQRRQAGTLSLETEQALSRLFELRYGAADLLVFPPAQSNAAAKEQQWPGRIPPVTDTKMIVAWNGLMISGLAVAGQILQRRDWYELALQAADFILQHQIQGQLQRLNYDGRAVIAAQAEDYALLIKALLDLHQSSLTLALEEREGPTATGTADRFLQAARQLQAGFDTILWSPDGGYFNAAGAASQDLVVLERSWQDNATPSANAVAAANLVRLFLLTEEVTYLERAEQVLRAFSGCLEKTAQACPSLFSALDTYLQPLLLKTDLPILRRLMQQYSPTVTFQTVPVEVGVTGYLCQGLRCQAPATSFVQLQQQLQAAVYLPD
jgi:uncharacterized protein YyaL (SSP411 family)